MQSRNPHLNRTIKGVTGKLFSTFPSTFIPNDRAPHTPIVRYRPPTNVIAYTLTCTEEVFVMFKLYFTDVLSLLRSLSYLYLVKLLIYQLA